MIPHTDAYFDEDLEHWQRYPGPLDCDPRCLERVVEEDGTESNYLVCVSCLRVQRIGADFHWSFPSSASGRAQ